MSWLLSHRFKVPVPGREDVPIEIDVYSQGDSFMGTKASGKAHYNIIVGYGKELWNSLTNPPGIEPGLATDEKELEKHAIEHLRTSGYFD